VLLVDDDEQMRGALAKLYQRTGWEVLQASDGHAALQLLFAMRPTLVVLDLGMAGLDGWETLARIRELTNIPVLMLTASSGELEKVRAFRAGADDYVTKPFSHQELLARTESLVRRAALPRDDEARMQLYRDDRVEVNYTARTVMVDDQEVPLTPLEFRLLGAFVNHPNHILSTDQLLSLAWESGVGTRGQVKLYVGYLRRKLGAAAQRIETVRGFGYRYRAGGRPLQTSNDS
jgi:DNA-binding response OmpR family regulator